MFTKAIRFARSISESAKDFSFVAHKTTLFNGVALMVACGIGAVLPTPAQAGSFAFGGFGCIDDAACQSYLEFSNLGIDGFQFDGLSFGWNLPPTRMSPGAFYNVFSGGPKIADSSSVNIPDWGSSSISASIWTDLQLGTLKAKAEAEAKAEANNSVIPTISQASAMVFLLGWGDTFTVTSNNHSPEELIPFEVRLHLDRSVSASEYGQASVYSDLYAYPRDSSYPSSGDVFNLALFDSNYYPSNITEVTTIAYLPVGKLLSLEGRLWVGADAQGGAYLPEQPYQFDRAIANASHTANYYLTPLVDGVSYTSASGKTYFYSPPVNKVPEPTSPLSFIGLVGLGFAFLGKRRNCTEKEPVITNKAG